MISLPASTRTRARRRGTRSSANITATIGLPKRGLLEPRAVEFVGAVEVVDIGLPEELASGVESDLELITVADLRAILARRQRHTHKGSSGNSSSSAEHRAIPAPPPWPSRRPPGPALGW